MRTSKNAARPKDRVYVFRVTLDVDESPMMHGGAVNRGIRRGRVPPVRDVAVLGRHNLYTLAEAINEAFGFAFDHCFGFYSEVPKQRYHDAERQYELFADLPDVEPTQAASVEKTFVHEVWGKVGDRMRFLFDYGTCGGCSSSSFASSLRNADGIRTPCVRMVGPHSSTRRRARNLTAARGRGLS